jgi:hypothetical protein
MSNPQPKIQATVMTAPRSQRQYKIIKTCLIDPGKARRLYDQSNRMYFAVHPESVDYARKLGLSVARFQGSETIL